MTFETKQDRLVFTLKKTWTCKSWCRRCM